MASRPSAPTENPAERIDRSDADDEAARLTISGFYAAGSMAHQSEVIVLTNSATGQSIMPDVATELCPPSRGSSVPISNSCCVAWRRQPPTRSFKCIVPRNRLLLNDETRAIGPWRLAKCPHPHHVGQQYLPRIRWRGESLVATDGTV
jgi:hypothetical protein